MSSEKTRPLVPRQLDDSEEAGAPAPVGSILSIENVAETFGIGSWTLRLCELRGLIKRRSRIGSARVYSWADCERIAFVIKCRRAGLRFSEIASIVRAAESDSARIHEAGQELCLAMVQQLETRRRAIDEAMSELKLRHSALGAKLAGEF